ncbi:non-ribosomal peptide synthetase [Nocardia sp. NBC_01499]|uniref:non-ribosomal peptide synthetase n=1 Tax=Nocardia sp. NBC_01499 TaxID=2903597 RepID=UPI00386B7B06
MTDRRHDRGVVLSRQRDSTTPAWFRATAVRFADHVAVRDDTRALTYSALAHRVEVTANALRDKGIEQGDLVALCAARSADLVIAVLAVMAAGAAPAPVDASQARSRAKETIAELRPKLTLADHDGRAVVPDATPLDDLLNAAPEPTEPSTPSANDLAYVLHTSGSTGKPRPVFVPHGALANRIAWAQATYPLGPGDAVLHAGSMIYDFSFWDVLAPLCCGATVVIAPEGVEAEPTALAELIVAQQVTAAHFIPTLLTEFLGGTDGSALRHLRLMFCGGEALSADLARRLRAATSGRIFNQYGPTEACIDVLAWELPDRDLAAESVPVGRPISGVTAHLLGADAKPVPVGQPGVLYVGGECLAWGYRDMGAATAAVFVPDPTGREPGARLYCTGDLMRARPDGAFEFIGRADNQLKIRGVRVEPGEVEAAVQAHPQVRQAAVVPVRDRRGEPSLAAHLVGTDGPVDQGGLRRFLAERLPSVALPSYYRHHRSLPKLASGKVDRSALAGLAVEPAQSTEGENDQPETPTQARLAIIWAEVLGVADIGRSSDFFELGGQSLLAMRLIARVRKQFKVRIPARVIFDAPTPETFGALLDMAVSQ